MKNRIIVIGCSFNPPTRAHLQLMEAAIKAVDARQDIFALTTHEYVPKRLNGSGVPRIP